VRSPAGSVRGVYGWTLNDGSPATIAYARNPGSPYQNVLNPSALGIPLPSFPYSLYR